jgi:hypothetical protein
MDARITRLLDAFSRAQGEPPSDVGGFLRSLPEVGELPSPWETWTLIGLVRHRVRQWWVHEIIRTRLQGDPSTLARLGSMGHPDDVPQNGSVPGLPEWEYFFHGIGCCLTHKVTGEQIDVNFWGDTAEHFDVFFYTNYLKSLRQPEPPEQRLRELYPSLRAIRLASDSLVAAGALIPLAGRDSHPPRVSDEVLDRADAIEGFCPAWAGPRNRLWLAALIGDWPAAHAAAAGQPGHESITAPRAERCRQLRRKFLLGVTGYDASDALYGLTELGAADAEVEQALRGHPSGLTSAALNIVAQQNDPRWCPHVYALFRRLNASGQLPEPHNWITALKFLLEHGYRKDEMIAALPKAGRTTIGEAVILAMEHAPEHALPLIRKGLLANIPVNRTEVAAVLALIAKPWSMRELLGALEASDDQERTADARAALLETGDADAEKAVLAWEERNPHEGEPGSYLEIDGRRVGPFYSMAEHMLKSRGAFIRYEMDKLHDRVARLRDREPPPEPPGLRPWWQFWDCLGR